MIYPLSRERPTLFSDLKRDEILGTSHAFRKKDPLYITTPIYYVNDVPHIGHAYTTAAADMMARFWKIIEAPTYFLTGVDEHGAKVAQSAKAKDVLPQTYVDTMANIFKDLVRVIDAEPHDFIRTTESRHHHAAQTLWKTLEARGQIYLGTYSGWYATRDEAFYAESELQDGKAPTGASVEWVEESCYFFKLSQWQEPLLAYYKEHPEAIGPKERYNETLRFIESGLKDLAISRTKLAWGIGVPSHVGHVMYVWLDALTNYITALGYPDTDFALYQTFWPHSIHLVGKDILRFHTVYWPAFLMAAGLTPPARVFAHGWWTREGQKMSKSLGNVLDPFALVARYGSDCVRYFLLREIKFGQDGDIVEALLVQRCNQELGNALGNLAQRVLAFVHQYFPQGVTSSPEPAHASHVALQSWGRRVLPYLQHCIVEQDLFAYIDTLQQSVHQVNAYVAEFAPWTLRKAPEHAQHLEEGLYSLCCFLRDTAILFSPVIPKAMHALLAQMHEETCTIKRIGVPLHPGPWIKPEPLFKKLEWEA